MFQIVLEFSLFLLVILFGVFQVILPLAQNRKIFPLFRTELSEAEKSLTETNQVAVIQEILEKKAEAEQVLHKRKTTNKQKRAK